MATRLSRRNEVPAVRRATNVSLDTKLVDMAKEYGITFHVLAKRVGEARFENVTALERGKQGRDRRLQRLDRGARHSARRVSHVLMAQFDVFVRRGGPGFVLDCQAATLFRLNTRFVVPLLPRAAVPSLVTLLNPLFEIDKQQVVLYPQNAATVSVRELGQAIVSLERCRYEIMSALDMLLTGY